MSLRQALSSVYRVAQHRSVATSSVVSVARTSAARNALLMGQRSFSVSIELIKKLRAATGAPIGDCKKALSAEDVNGDMEKAFVWLRKRGMAQASKKADRVASEGLVAVTTNAQGEAVIVELNSETDFVARNELFQGLLSRISNAALAFPTPSSPLTSLDVEEFAKTGVKGADGHDLSVSEAIAEIIGRIGENLSLRRVTKLSVTPTDGFISSYVHGSVGPGLGRAATVIAVQAKGFNSLPQSDAEALQLFGKRLAMHIVAARPSYVDPAHIPEELVKREKDMLMDQAKGSGKPANILEKMVQGRLSKFYGEIALTEQPHMVEEGNPVVKAVVKDLEKKVNTSVKILDFVRYEIGEAPASAAQSEENVPAAA